MISLRKEQHRYEPLTWLLSCCFLAPGGQRWWDSPPPPTTPLPSHLHRWTHARPRKHIPLTHLRACTILGHCIEGRYSLKNLWLGSGDRGREWVAVDLVISNSRWWSPIPSPKWDRFGSKCQLDDLELGSSDSGNKNTEHTVKFEFQINNE